MKKLLYLSIAILLSINALHAGGGKNCLKDYSYEQQLRLTTEQLSQCPKEQQDIISNLQKSEQEREKQKKAKTKITGKTGCRAGKMIVSQCGQDLEVECNADAEMTEVKVLCDTGSNAVGDMIYFKKPIPSSNIKSIGNIEKEKSITNVIEMPKKGETKGFSFSPTEGKYTGKKIWYIIRDESIAGTNLAIIKIYRASGKKIDQSTGWEEMATITNESMTYDELIKAFDGSKQNNKGIIISTDGTITLDFMAKDPSENRRMTFNLDPIK